MIERLIPAAFVRQHVRASRILRNWQRRTGAYRAACWLSYASSFGLCACIAYLGAKGRGYEVSGVPAHAAVVIAWICGVFLGLSNANNRVPSGQAAGIASLISSHGVGELAMTITRVTASSVLALRVFVTALLPVVVIAAVASPTLHLAAWRAAMVVPMAVFAVLAAISVGVVPSLCALVSARHGRALFVLVVLLPWWLQGFITPSRSAIASIPALLAAVSHWMTQLGGG